MGFGTGPQAVAAAVASCVVKADAHDGGARQAADERPEGAERAEVTAPAVLHERKVEREDRGCGRERCEPRAEDEITPDPGLRAHRLEGGRARGGAQNERGGEKTVADLVRDAHDVGLELEANAKPFGGVGHHVHGADPAAEGARAQKAVEHEDDEGAESGRERRHVPRRKALEERKRVGEWDRAGNFGGRERAVKERLARERPPEARRARKEPEHRKLKCAAGKRPTHVVEPLHSAFSLR